jgi:hypothetical protein
MKLPAPTQEHVCDMSVSSGPIREMESGRAGNRRIIPTSENESDLLKASRQRDCGRLRH